MQVAPQPAAFLLARRDDRHARPPQVGGQPDPTHRQAERADELVEHLCSSRARIDGPCPSRRPAARRPRRDGASSDLAVVLRRRAGRRRPLPATGQRQVDGDEVEAQATLEAGHESREQVVARVGAHVIDDALHDAERVVASAVHEPVDEAPDPVPRGLVASASRRLWRRGATSGRSRRPGARARRPDRVHDAIPAATAPTPASRCEAARVRRQAPQLDDQCPGRPATARSRAAAAPTTSCPANVQSTTSRPRARPPATRPPRRKSHPSSGSPSGDAVPPAAASTTIPRRWPTAATSPSRRRRAATAPPARLPRRHARSWPRRATAPPASGAGRSATPRGHAAPAGTSATSTARRTGVPSVGVRRERPRGGRVDSSWPRYWTASATITEREPTDDRQRRRAAAAAGRLSSSAGERVRQAGRRTRPRATSSGPPARDRRWPPAARAAARQTPTTAAVAGQATRWALGAWRRPSPSDRRAAPSAHLRSCPDSTEAGVPDGWYPRPDPRPGPSRDASGPRPVRPGRRPRMLGVRSTYRARGAGHAHMAVQPIVAALAATLPFPRCRAGGDDGDEQPSSSAGRSCRPTRSPRDRRRAPPRHRR